MAAYFTQPRRTSNPHHSTGRSCRYGYARDGVTQDPREAEAIRWAAARVLNGQSVSSLARELDDRGVHPVKAAKWSSKSLTDILRSPRIAGLRVHRGEVVGKAEWAPILDLETHQAVTAALHQRGKGAVQPKLQRWCNQLLYCGHCGATLWGAHAPGRRPFRYWCNSRQGGCGRKLVSGVRPWPAQLAPRWILTPLGPTRPPAAEFEPALTDQLDDVRALQADAANRGWTGEEERHRHGAQALENHLDSVQPR